MVEAIDFLILGGGLAGANAAATLVKEGAKGRIVLISADEYPPYNRPPLSKGFLLGLESKESVFVQKEAFYQEAHVDLILRTRVSALDLDKRVVKTQDGQEFGFRKLLIATGTAPRKLNVPGVELGGIYYLRTLSDSEALKEAMTRAKRAVVIGAGFIGMELASVFAQKGIQTKILDLGARFFERFASEQLSDFFRAYYEKQGVKILFQEATKEFRGKERVESVVTESGKVLPCDLVAVGIGVLPEVDFLAGTSLEVRNGVVVDEYLQTSDGDIFAAGDVANFFDPIFGRRRRIEHWDNAIKQGRLAALNMLGRHEAYNHVSYFFSEIFELYYDFLGDMTDHEEILYRGSFAQESVAALYLKQNVLQAVFLMGRPPEERRVVERLILEKVNLGRFKDKIEDESFRLREVLS